MGWETETDVPIFYRDKKKLISELITVGEWKINLWYLSSQSMG